MPVKGMQYTFGLHTCRLGAAGKTMKNPFTGEAIIAPIDKGLSPAERKAVKLFLEKSGAHDPDECGFHAIEFLKSDRVLLGFGDLDADHPLVSIEVDITCRRLSQEILTFVFELAETANMAFVDLKSVALTKPPTDPLVKQRWPNATIVSTPAELEGWIKKTGGMKVEVWDEG